MPRNDTVKCSSDLMKSDLLSEVLLAGSGVVIFVPWLLILVAVLAKLPQ